MDKWLLLHAVIIASLLSGITFYYGRIMETEKMKIDVLDGYNIDEERGCFFILLACKRVHIDPSEHTFWIAEEGKTPKILSFEFRHYGQDGNWTPRGGDRNKTYVYEGSSESEKDGGIWEAGEAIAFDMPLRDLELDIKDQTVYEISIRNKYQFVLWQGEFVYKIL